MRGRRKYTDEGGGERVMMLMIVIVIITCRWGLTDIWDDKF
jgi:hypothetical protein